MRRDDCHAGKRRFRLALPSSTARPFGKRLLSLDAALEQINFKTLYSALTVKACFFNTLCARPAPTLPVVRAFSPVKCSTGNDRQAGDKSGQLEYPLLRVAVKAGTSLSLKVFFAVAAVTTDASMLPEVACRAFSGAYNRYTKWKGFGQTVRVLLTDGYCLQRSILTPS